MQGYKTVLSGSRTGSSDWEAKKEGKGKEKYENVSLQGGASLAFGSAASTVTE